MEEDYICWIDDAVELTAEELLEMAAVDAALNGGRHLILFGPDFERPGEIN